MPFPMVYGIPKHSTKTTLKQLRRDIVALLVKEMPGVPASWVRPIFPADMLDDPKSEEDGSSTIYVSLATGMFYPDSAKPPASDVDVVKVLTALGQVVWDAFEGKYEVELFVDNLNPNWKALIKTKEEQEEAEKTRILMLLNGTPK